jgi:hypothetical protein
MEVPYLWPRWLSGSSHLRNGISTNYATRLWAGQQAAKGGPDAKFGRGPIVLEAQAGAGPGAESLYKGCG